MSRDLTVYLPCGQRAVIRRRRQAERFRTARPRPPVHHPLPDDELYACARTLLGSQFCVDAQEVLVCDDGVCGPLAWALSDVGLDVYVLDPRLRLVYRDLTTAEALELRDTPGIQPTYRLFEDLPYFDLFLVGCASFSELGFVYSPDAGIKRAYRAIRRAHLLGFDTATVVVAPARQVASSALYPYAFAKAKYRLGPNGVDVFPWWEDRIADSDENAPDQGEFSEITFVDMTDGWDIPGLKQSPGGGARQPIE